MNIKSIYVSGYIENTEHYRELLEKIGYQDILFSCLEDYVGETFEENMKHKISCLVKYSEIAFVERWREQRGSVLEYDLCKRLKIPMKFFSGDTLEDKPQVGFKMSNDKIKWSLLDLSGLHGMLSVLMHGSLKYSDDNWKRVPNGKQEYYDALMRHISDLRSGKEYDEETGQLTIYCIQTNAYFLGYFIEQEKKV